MKKAFKSWGKINLSIPLFLLACFFIYLGYHRGEVTVVFEKAVRICMECIGIG